MALPEVWVPELNWLVELDLQQCPLVSLGHLTKPILSEWRLKQGGVGRQIGDVDKVNKNM